MVAKFEPKEHAYIVAEYNNLKVKNQSDGVLVSINDIDDCRWIVEKTGKSLFISRWETKIRVTRKNLNDFLEIT